MTRRLDQIRARVEAATEGPWSVEECDPEWQPEDAAKAITFGAYPNEQNVFGTCDGCPAGKTVDARFIAAARTDVPWMLDRIAELEGALKLAHDFYPCEGSASCIVAKALAAVSE